MKDLFSQCTYVHKCQSCLGILTMLSGFPASCLSFIAYEVGTLEIGAWACWAFRACRARAATPGVKPWAWSTTLDLGVLHLLPPILHI